MKKNYDHIILSMMTLLTVLAWIAFEVYHIAVTSTITEAQEQLITPLEPKLDTAGIDSIKSRMK